MTARRFARTTETEVILERFVRMRRAGAPRVAVASAMRASGLDVAKLPHQLFASDVETHRPVKRPFRDARSTSRRRTTTTETSLALPVTVLEELSSYVKGREISGAVVSRTLRTLVESLVPPRNAVAEAASAVRAAVASVLSTFDQPHGENDKQPDVARRCSRMVGKSRCSRKVDPVCRCGKHGEGRCVLHCDRRSRACMAAAGAIRQPHVRVFGSALTGLCLGDSDVDLHVDWPSTSVSNRRRSVTSGGRHSSRSFGNGAWRDASTVAKILRDNSPGRGVLDVRQVIRARVNVIKAVVNGRRKVDIVVNQSELGCYNSELLRAYVETDARVFDLVMLVRIWAKQRSVGSAVTGTLSSYAWTVLALDFLMKVPTDMGGPLIADRRSVGPVFDVNRVVDGFRVRFFSGAAEPLSTSASLEDLLRGFFAFYAAHSDFAPGSNGMHWISDPFEHTHDLSAPLSPSGFRRISREIKRAHELVSRRNFADLFRSHDTQEVELPDKEDFENTDEDQSDDDNEIEHEPDDDNDEESDHDNRGPAMPDDEPAHKIRLPPSRDADKQGIPVKKT